MNIMRKTVALLLLAMFICGCLASCINPGPDSGDGSNDGSLDNLQTDKYVANIEIKYATNDNKMKAAIDAMGSSVATLWVDGDDIKLVTNASVDNISIVNEYIYIGDRLYNSKSVTVDDKSISTLKSAAMTSDQCESLISKVGPGASIGIEDFLMQEQTTAGGIVTYLCEEINDEAKESLCDIFASKFAGLDAIVRIESASYQLEVLNDRNVSSILSCDFVITMDGVDHEVTMHLYYDYDYDAEFSISSPESIDGYTEVSVDEIIG